MFEYAFDVQLYACIRVKAETEADARKLMDQHLHCADANFGSWPNGDPILAEVSPTDDYHDLLEIDGEAV